MKTLLLLFLLFLLPDMAVFAQNTGMTEKEILLEIVKQQTKLSEQQAITATKVESLEKSIDKRFDSADKRIDTFEKSVDKRFDMLFYLMLGMLAGIFGLIGSIFWDRRAFNAPIKTKVITLQKEVKQLKEKELKHLEKETKMELYIKQISQIDNRFAPFNP